MLTNMRIAHNKTDLKGQKFNRLLVIKEGENLVSPCGTKRAKWECLCDCGNVSYVTTTELRSGHTKSCGCWSREQARKAMTGQRYYVKRRLGTKNVKKSYFDRVRKGAIERNLEFNISIEDMQSLLEKQNFKCALTGDDITMSLENSAFRIAKGIAIHNTASLDRIDSSKGYTLENIQWVHKEINLIKQNLKEQDLLVWCKKLINYNIDKLNERI